MYEDPEDALPPIDLDEIDKTNEEQYRILEEAHK